MTGTEKSLIALLAGLFMWLSPPIPAALAGDKQVTTGFTYSTDSDGVVAHSYRSGTDDEDNPLNFTAYHTNIRQGGSGLKENTVVGKWRGMIGQAPITVWMGYLKNDIYNFTPYAVMYDKGVGPNDHLWLSYSRDAIGTVQAYQKGVYSKTAAISYLHSIASDVEINAQAAYTTYSDNNKRQIINLAGRKQLTPNFKLGLNYRYDDARHKASPVYYVPVEESVVLLTPEWSIPLGSGKLVITAEQSLAGHNSDGPLKLHRLGTYLAFANFSLGTEYFKAGEYNSRNWHINWNHTW